MMMTTARIMAGAARLLREERGATLPEFAMILPTFLLLLVGIFDIGQTIYVRSVLQGAVQQAGRNAGLESGLTNLTAIDNYVRNQMEPVAISNATFNFQRKNYYTFSDVGRPEDFTDTNNNDVYDTNECFVDENGNSQWDDDVGKGGLGGANDVVLYTATVNYDRIFPLWKLINDDEQMSLSATTILRNQPFGSQGVRGPKQICPAP